MGAALLGWLGERVGSRQGNLDVVLAADGLGGDPPLELVPGVGRPGPAQPRPGPPAGGPPAT